MGTWHDRKERLIVQVPMTIAMAALDAVLAKERWSSSQPVPPRLVRTLDLAIGEHFGVTVVETPACERSVLDPSWLLERFAPVLSEHLGCRCAFVHEGSYDLNSCNEWNRGTSSLVYSEGGGEELAYAQGLAARPSDHAWLEPMLEAFRNGEGLGTSAEELVTRRMGLPSKCAIRRQRVSRP